MTINTLILFIAGFGLLIIGAEALVRGSSQLAIIIGISPIVIGLTVVALGTSAPEVTVTVQSALAGQSDLTLGNVVGSSIANMLLVLGLSALATPGGGRRDRSTRWGVTDAGWDSIHYVDDPPEPRREP